MSEIRKLNKFSKHLEFFGLQFHSISTKTLNSPPKFASISHIIYFIVYSSLFLLGLCFLNGPFYELIQNVSLNENLLGYSLEMFITTQTIGQIFFSIFESFLKVKSNKKFFILLFNFDKFLKLKMRTKIDIKKFRKILKRRLILLYFSATMVILSDTALIKIYGIKELLNLVMIFTHFVTVCLVLFKICFYVDLLCICLMKFNEILDQIVALSHNRKLLLRKIYQCKQCYIIIIEMSKELNNFLSLTLNAYIYVGVLWMTMRFYHFFELNFVNPARYYGEFYK